MVCFTAVLCLQLHLIQTFKGQTQQWLWHFAPLPRNLCLSQLPCSKDSPWDPWDPHQRSAKTGVPRLRLCRWDRWKRITSSTRTSFFYSPLPFSVSVLSACRTVILIVPPGHWSYLQCVHNNLSPAQDSSYSAHLIFYLPWVRNVG